MATEQAGSWQNSGLISRRGLIAITAYTVATQVVSIRWTTQGTKAVLMRLSVASFAETLN